MPSSPNVFKIDNLTDSVGDEGVPSPGYCGLQAFDEGLHLGLVLAYLEEEVPLVACACEIVVGILALPVVVAREVVPKEAYTLHVGEELGSVGQERDFDRREECCRLHVSACESAEDVHAEVDVAVLGRVLRHGVGGSAQEVAVVADEERGHHRVEVDDAEHIALVVEHHVVHLRVAVAHALLQLALGKQALAETHLVHAALYLGNEVGYSGSAPRRIALHHLAQLVAAQAHVVEVGYGFSELVGDFGELRLEIAEGVASVIGRVLVDGLHGHGVVDEHGDAPVGVGLCVVIERLAVVGVDEAEHAAVDVVDTLCLELLANVSRHGLDVVLQQFYIGEDVVVDALQHIVGSGGLNGRYLVGVVDESVAERFYVEGRTLYVEMADDFR